MECTFDCYTEPSSTAPSASNLSFMNRNITYNNNYVWSQQEEPKASNMKAILAQSFAALTIFLLNFNNVIFSAFLMYEPTLELIDTHSIMYMVGLIVGGVLAQIIGSSPMIMLGATVSIAGWLTFRLTTSTVVLLWIVRFVGFTWGMMQSPFYVYLAEIAQPNVRGALMTTVNLSLTIGVYFSALLVQKASLTTFGWINLIIPIVGFIAMIILPESPHWLANKGRYQSAESSLAWFRGWKSPTHTTTEYATITDHAQNNPSTLQLLGKNSFYISLLVVSYVFAIKAFSGIEFLKINMLISNSPNNKFNVRPILQHGYYLVTIGFFVAVAIIRKRILILLSLFSGSLALLLIIILKIASQEKLISTATSSWLLPICMITAILVLQFGLGHVPLLLNGELFPSRLRYVGTGIGLLIMKGLEYASVSIYTKHVTYPSFTPTNLFLILGCINLFGFITLYWLFPENRNKSIVKIEESCDSISNLTRKQ